MSHSHGGLLTCFMFCSPKVVDRSKSDLTCFPLVDGNWTSWIEWGNCSVTCGDGAKTRSRTCTDPSPANGGSDCVGSPSETDACSTSDCPGTVLTTKQ